MQKHDSRIGPEKYDFDQGLTVNFHQDTPVVKPDMLYTIWCAVNRITRMGVNIGPGERVSVYDALKSSYDRRSYTCFEEDRKGSIKEGKLADLMILDQNPSKVDEMRIKDIRVMETGVIETIKEGKMIYRVDLVAAK